MLAALRAALVGLLGSKKFLVTVATIAGTAACKHFGCDADTVRDFLLAGLALVGAQGMADFGKARTAPTPGVALVPITTSASSAPSTVTATPTPPAPAPAE